VPRKQRRYTIEAFGRLVDLRAKLGVVQSIVFTLQKQIESGLPDRMFREQNPTFRQCLIGAAEFRLRNARSVRIGTPAVTTRSMKEEEMLEILKCVR
jgi:glycine/serine hydroxymethyltransferase